jgi:hypothetical protein
VKISLSIQSRSNCGLPLPVNVASGVSVVRNAFRAPSLMVATSLRTTGLRAPGKSWVLLHGLLGEWPAEPDADVEDDAGSDEAEGGGGDPLVGGGPCPADAIGVGGQDVVERERDQGGEDEVRATGLLRAV